MPVPGPLLITDRPDFARQVAELAPDVALAVAAPDTVTVQRWASASAVFLDALALPVLRTRALPSAHHGCVIADTAPTSDLFVDAVALRIERVAELPVGASWLADALRAAVHRAMVVAVVGIGTTGEAATAVALALALDSLRREERVAVVGLRRGQSVVDRLTAVATDTPTPDPHRRGVLSIVTRGDQPAPAGHLTDLITELRYGHDLVILDTPAPSNPAGREVLTDAHVVLAVATPDERHHPDLAALTAPDSPAAGRLRVAILTTRPAIADGSGHALTPPGSDPSRWITDPTFGRQCTAAVADRTPPGRNTTGTDHRDGD